MAFDPRLLDYCNTDRQREILLSMQETGSGAETARRLGLTRTAPDRLLRRIRERASRQGYAPGHFSNGTAPGYVMAKVTVQRAGDGTVERTWERQLPDADRLQDALRAAVDAMAGEVAPCAPVKAPDASQGDLLTLYTFTDYHVGMLAWHREGGDDWDLKIAEEMGTKAMIALTAGAPDSEHGIVNIQGDFVHWDGLTAITPQHGHVLDADGRFGKVVDVAIRLIRRLVAQALAKHQHVTLLICEGNHDLASSLWLRKLFAALYENEPRITVHDSELPYYAIEWGVTMLGFHHGHLRKNEQLPALFAAQFRPMWGRCSKVYIHTGHKHHKDERDHTGARVTQHPTLAGRDAYAARGGWWSEREITANTYSKRFGWAGANNVTPEMCQ
jgi:hypothetical protein